GGHAGQDLGGGPAGLCPRLEPVGRRRLASSQERGDALSGVAGSGGVAPRIPPRRRSPAAKTAFVPVLLRPGWIEDPTRVTFFAQRSVIGLDRASSPPAKSRHWPGGS